MGTIARLVLIGLVTAAAFLTSGCMIIND